MLVPVNIEDSKADRLAKSFAVKVLCLSLGRPSRLLTGAESPLGQSGGHWTCGSLRCVEAHDLRSLCPCWFWEHIHAVYDALCAEGDGCWEALMAAM